MKIIKFNIGKQLRTLKAGGGTPELKVPNSISGLERIRSDLRKIYNDNMKREKFVIVLFHNEKGAPAISRRFCSCMCTIFGSTKFDYDKNIMLDEGLGFHYVVTPKYLDIALDRLDVIIEFMKNEIVPLRLEEWFVKLWKKQEGFQNIEHRIESVLKRSINCISKSSLISLLFRAEFVYKKIVAAKDEHEISYSDNNIICSFINDDFAAKAIQHIKDENIPIIYNGHNLLEIKLPKNKKITLLGLSKAPYQALLFSSNNLINSEDELTECLFSNLENSIELNNIPVGVIDGGIGTNSVVLKKVKYKSFKELGIFEKEIYKSDDQNHAEMVTSMLLWANKLSTWTKDNCRQPDITLFDVVREGMTPGEFIKIVEVIIQKYYKEIRIWNLSVNFLSWRNKNTWSKGVTDLAIRLDEIQKEYKVLFILSSGNKGVDGKSDDVILAPSDCIRGITVSCSLPNGNKCDYSLNGQCTQNLYYTSKPDISTSGCDNEGYFRVIKDGHFSRQQGVSFAVPLIVRKVAELYSNDIDLSMIPAILNCIASYNSNKLDDYSGYGVIPMDINDILNMKNNNALITFSINPKNYSQGFFKMKFPKDNKGNYPLSFTYGVNVEANTSKNSSFEYVEDTARIQIGAVEPQILANRLISHTKIQIINGDDDDSYKKDDVLRKLFGKYKNRYCCKRDSVRSISGYKHINNDLVPIEYFGVTITRNDLKSARKGDLMTHVCLLVSSINGSMILDDIKNLNMDLVDVNLNIDKSNSFDFE